MSNIFTAFLDNVVAADGYMYDWAHASRLYRDDRLYDYSPKTGWMYYIRLGINPEVKKYFTKTYLDSWVNRNSDWVGLLAKQADQPRFTIQTETLNQYNRKSVVQTKLSYQPVTITFHDDMANSTTNLWNAYYTYYFADGNHGLKATTRKSNIVPEFSDTKFKAAPVAYGLSTGFKVPFFTDITIYTLYKKKFSSITLVNPIIKEWQHSGLDQTSGTKLLENKMQVEFESVVYNSGKASTIGFNKEHYDRTPSPLAIGGNGPGGLLATIGGAADVFGEIQDINSETSPLDLLRIGLKTANVVASAQKITRASLKQEAYSLVAGIGRGISAGYVDTSNVRNFSNSVVNTFVFPNSSVDRSIKATPVAETRPTVNLPPAPQPGTQA